MTEVDVEMTEVDVEMTEVDVEMTEVDVEMTEVDVEMTEVDVEMTEVDVEMTEVDVEMTEVDVEMTVTRKDQNQTKIKREKSLEEDNKSFFWIKSDGQQKIATENLIPGNQVYKEKLILKKGVEYRLWDPFRSKLAAAIMNSLEYFPFKNQSKVLYLRILNRNHCKSYFRYNRTKWNYFCSRACK